MIREMTFERFETRGVHLPPEDRRRVENAYRQAMSFAEEPAGWLLFMGAHGAGKTHLAGVDRELPAPARRDAELHRRARPPRLPAPRLLNADDARTSADAFDEMKTAPLLILDDLDTQTGIAWVRDRLFQLLNYRHTARLPTVITTALSLDDLGERLASRLVDPAVCTVIVLGEPQRVEPPPKRARRTRK